MTWAEYLEILWADAVFAVAWWALGVAMTLAALYHWRIEISHLMTHPKSGLIVPDPDGHVVTQKPTLQEIQQLSGKP